MDSTATAHNFEAAATLERHLTERQWVVLRLIADGKTNPEIAEHFGISLAGAKWHVSELLSKLQLESREAAAGYYRWRRRPARRVGNALRGVTGISALKVGIAAAAVGGVVIVFGVGASFRGGEPASGAAEPGLPFYMETRVWRDDPGLAAPLEGSAAYWYQDEGHLRTEVESGQEAARANILVRDGVNQWRNGPMYRAEPLTKFASSSQSIPGTSLGPLGYTSIEAYLAGDADGVIYERTGRGKLLGIPVEVLSRSVFDSAQAIMNTRTIWIDPERLLVLKVVSTFGDGQGGQITEGEEATLLRYGEDQPGDRFVFVPDPGAVELTCPDILEAFARGEFFAPFWRLPDGITPTSLERFSFGVQAQPDGTCGAAIVDYRMAGTEEAVLRVRQELAEPTSVLPATGSTPLDVPGAPGAVVGLTSDGKLVVAWLAGPLGFEISSERTPQSELVDFATAFIAANRDRAP